MEHEETNSTPNNDEIPRIEAVSIADVSRNGDDCMGCAGKQWC